MKPNEVKTFTLTKCDYNVGSKNIGEDIVKEEAAKDKLCSTVIWAMEQKGATTKLIFNKWYQEKYDDTVDEDGYKKIYGNFIKMCSMTNYEYDCQPTQVNCELQIQDPASKIWTTYPNGAIGKSSYKIAQVWKDSQEKNWMGTVAWVDTWNPLTINLCPITFMNENPELKKHGGLNSRLGTLFHEYSHFKWSLGTHDTGAAGANGYDTKVILEKSRKHNDAADKTWDGNAKVFDSFVEDLYRETGYASWDDVKAANGKRSGAAIDHNLILVLLIFLIFLL